MIGVTMREEYRIDFSGGNPQLHQPLAARFACVHEHGRSGGA